jgi:hypothetical protein
MMLRPDRLHLPTNSPSNLSPFVNVLHVIYLVFRRVDAFQRTSSIIIHTSTPPRDCYSSPLTSSTSIWKDSISVCMIDALTPLTFNSWLKYRRVRGHQPPIRPRTRNTHTTHTKHWPPPSLFPLSPSSPPSWRTRCYFVEWWSTLNVNKALFG